MIVSKFGGTSVGSAENIQKVIKIAGDKNDKVALVVSAMGGVTNLLIQASELALDNDLSYLDILKEIEDRHLQAISALLQDDLKESGQQHLKNTL